MSDRVVINVSGTTFETRPETLKRFPDTLLGSPTKRRRYYDNSVNEYYFNRHRIAFEYILFYYQSNGRLILPHDVPFRVFTEEVQFFQLGEQALNSIAQGMLRTNTVWPRRTVQEKLWNIFEHPDTSSVARLVAIFSISMIVTSLVLSCIETLPSMGMDECPGSIPNQCNNTSNGLQGKHTSHSCNTTLENWAVKCHHQNHRILTLLETICYSWFLFEYTLRFLTAPIKSNFLFSMLNLIDILAIFPFFIVLFVGNRKVVSLSVLRIARLIRVFRIFKLTRYSSGLRILGNTVRASLKELEMVMLFIFMTVILSSSAVYYADIGSPQSQFRNIPEAFWWSINTITTVGYGDLIPVTALGKVVGSVCAVLGVLIFSLPVMALATNFNAYLKCEPIQLQRARNTRDNKSFRRSTIYK